MVTLTIKKPHMKLFNGVELPDTPATLGRVTETITKSTLTETVVTRITDNTLAIPVIIEVRINCAINLKIQKRNVRCL